MTITRGRVALAGAVLLFSLTASALAQTPLTQGGEISKETREKMAALHEEMASCLRSDKSITECQRDIAKRCKEQLGTEHCPMMMGMGHVSVDPRRRMQPMGSTPK